MKTTKKTIAILAILAIVCCSAFATETQPTAERSGWSVNAGTAMFDSHIGAAYSLGRWEFSANLYSGFPNLAIIGYVNRNQDSTETFLDYVKQSFTLAYAANIGAMYDVTKGDKFDLDLGFTISGIYTGAFKELNNFRGGVVALDLVSRIKFNFNDRNGIYIATELPLAGVLMATQKNSETGETTFSAAPFAVMTENYLQAALILAAYTTRIGYTYSF